MSIISGEQRQEGQAYWRNMDLLFLGGKRGIKKKADPGDPSAQGCSGHLSGPWPGATPSPTLTSTHVQRPRSPALTWRGTGIRKQAGPGPLWAGWLRLSVTCPPVPTHSEGSKVGGILLSGWRESPGTCQETAGTAEEEQRVPLGDLMSTCGNTTAVYTQGIISLREVFPHRLPGII